MMPIPIPASCDDDFGLDKRIAAAHYLIRCALREALHDQDDEEFVSQGIKIVVEVILDLYNDRLVEKLARQQRKNN
jgi:hypothetical protein